jgi:hypothetical protein
MKDIKSSNQSVTVYQTAEVSSTGIVLSVDPKVFETFMCANTVYISLNSNQVQPKKKVK